MSLNVIDFQNDVVAPWKDKLVRREAPLPVISVGRDRKLLMLREEILASRSNLRVRSVDPEEAEEPARSPASRLWIFCFTVELPKLVYLACSIRRYSAGSRLLLLTGLRDAGFEKCLFHQAVDPSGGQNAFLDTVRELALEA
jgi:hypothetical protein